MGAARAPIAFRPLRRWSIAAIACAAVGVVVDFVDSLSTRPSLVVINDPHATSSERAVAFSIVVLGGSFLIVLWAWSWRAAKNVRALGRTRLAFTPFTTVAWWLLPLVNLYMPYRAIREAWLASSSATDDSWRNEKPPITLLAWWLSTWIAAIMGFVDVLAIPALIVDVASIVCFAKFALALAARQQSAFERGASLSLEQSSST